MLVRHVAVVSQTTRITPREFTRVVAALQKQVTRDFAPIWGIQATVTAFARLQDVPIGYWRILIRDQVRYPGIHMDDGKQPYSLVRHSPTWSISASHEC